MLYYSSTTVCSTYYIYYDTDGTVYSTVYMFSSYYDTDPVLYVYGTTVRTVIRIFDSLRERFWVNSSDNEPGKYNTCTLSNNFPAFTHSRPRADTQRSRPRYAESPRSKGPGSLPQPRRRECRRICLARVRSRRAGAAMPRARPRAPE